MNHVWKIVFLTFYLTQEFIVLTAMLASGGEAYSSKKEFLLCNIPLYPIVVAIVRNYNNLPDNGKCEKTE